ncbi:glucokinase [Congregibacter brevis]|uniref:Glucokinase n=1 Tax=Congregibacter brevis TaxID=3081201 RepID=A0ABZ0IFS4_9GAMM|nr:glucokinase [Congregibacter sp. IMCC45268]
MVAKPWHLLADIGGTNARFALGDVGSGEIHIPLTVSVLDHPTFMSALQMYLSFVEDSGDWEKRPVDGCLAVACPTDREHVTFTNSDWVIDRENLGFSLEIPRLKIINDFEAIGYAAASFAVNDWEQIGGGESRPDKALTVLGPGTGLGVCGVLPTTTGVNVLPGEGGHVDFAPVGKEETEIMRLLLSRYSRVSAERLLSGTGLQNIYWALTQLHGEPQRHATPADISASALVGDDPVAVEALAVFCRVLGSVAGNLALTFGSLGGVYVAGGIAPRILEFLRGSDFRERFLAKGRFREYLEDIPTRIVVRNDPGLFGALKFLQSRHS